MGVGWEKHFFSRPMGVSLTELLLQIVVILAAARLCGIVMRRVGQPQVIGEMVAGILLGPTVLGRVGGGELMHWVFPKESQAGLGMLSQLGVILFMFLVGLELDLGKLVRQGSVVVRGAVGSMVVPFGLGIGLALGLLKAGYGPEAGGTREGFVVFIATGMAITAFPVLARILNGCALKGTEVAGMALACAALNDVAGWCLLATAVALQRAGTTTGGGDVVVRMMVTGGMVGVYIVVMLAGMRPLMRRLQGVFERQGALGADVMAVLFILLMASAAVTEWMGIHALFGAFMFGAVLPGESRFVEHLEGKVKDVVTLFLVPLFFAFTGLRTQLGVLDTAGAWGMAGIVTLVATVGKVGGTFVAVRGALGTRQATVLGVLMNTRGLMELVALNMAREVKAIDEKVFSMMVVMTLVTTVATGPVVGWLRRERAVQKEASPHLEGAGSGV